MASARFGLFTLLATLAALAGCTHQKEINYQVESKYHVDDPQFAQTVGALFGPSLVPGNSIRTLRNGDEIFPAMLAAIRSAQHTITLETYIYWSGQIGQEFTEALCERAQAGVHVHVLIDWL